MEPNLVGKHTMTDYGYLMGGGEGQGPLCDTSVA